MGNFKIRVNSEAESREVQELFFQLGGSWSGYKKIYDWPEIKQLYLSENYITFSNDINFFVKDHKELTLPELRDMVNDQYAEIEQVRQHRHYFIDVSDVDEIDFYEIALRYNVTDPCIQHILKKCLAVGQRGQKDFHHDLKDIYDTAKRMLDVHGLDS